MSLAMRIWSALVATSALALGGCTSLLGDFTYDANRAATGSGGGGMQGDIVVMPVDGLVTSELGAKATFTIMLKKAPNANVTVALASTNMAEGTVRPAAMTFTPDNYGAPQIAQVTGVADNKPDGPQIYYIITSPANSDDPHYRGLDPVDPQVTNIDNDTAGVTLMPPSGLITTESGREATFTVVLNHAPTADVVIPLSSDKPTEGTVSPTSLTFTAANWMAPQVVTVTGVDDNVKDGAQTFHVLTGAVMSADPSYANLDPPDELVTNEDNETAGIVLNPATGLVTNENGSMTSFTIALSSPPTSDVTVGLKSSDLSEGTVSPASLTFTSVNWMAPQVVSVTGVDDQVADGNQPYEIVISIDATNDPYYAALEPPNAGVTNIDNDSVGFQLTPPAGLMTGEDLTSATFSVVLNSKPSGDVLFDVTSSRMAEGIPTPTSLRFTNMNWDAPQVVTVMGVDDKVQDGNQTYVVHVAPNVMGSADADYGALLEQDVSLTNVDNDSAGFSVKPQKDLTTTEGGGSTTFTVKLTSQPTADVTIALSSSNIAEGTVSPAMLTFTADNYNSEQMVTVRGVDDKVQDGNQPYKIITDNAVSKDPNYNGRDVPNVSATNIDNDTAGITVQPQGTTLTTSEAGGSATFTVVLNTQPTGDVTFSVSSTDTTEGTVGPQNLKFTNSNWNGAQTITVKGVDDQIHDGTQQYRVAFSTITSTDLNYSGDRLKPLDVKLQNTDNDSAGISLRNIAGLTTTEKNNGTATFQVVLDSQPSGNVTMGLSSSRTSEGTVSPASLTFTAVNWAAPQSVTVTGVDDKVADGNQTYFVILAPAMSSDADYQGRVPATANITVTNIDDDSPGIRVMPTTGLMTSEQLPGTTTFTVQLNSQPTADVTIPLASSNTKEGTVGPASLTFTAANWNAPHTVTLTGVDDQVQDGDQQYTVTVGPATSNDTKYNNRSVPDLMVVNHDNDVAGILVSAISGDTTELNAGTATFTIVLQTQPTADVKIGLTSSNVKEGTVSPALVTFTAVNWASPQKITVIGVDDKVQDGNQPYTISVGTATSADAHYQGIDPNDVSVVNDDNDTAGITVSKISGTTSESGATATFTVVLDTQPTADVTMSVTSNNTSEGTVSDASVTFTTANWSSPQTITVTGIEDDGTADGNQPYSIVIGVATSTDKNYNTKQPAAVSVTNLDNDSAGVTVSAVAGQTSENGDTMSFTVVLNSKPKADVKIPLSSSDTSEGTVSTSLLTFTTTNWAAKQTVTVTGVDDNVVDGSAVYTVLIGAPTSTDAAYAAIDPPDVSMTNLDNDTADFVVGPVVGHTSEDGTNTTFTIKLTSKPKSDVTIPLSSSNNNEGSLTVTQVVLTSTDWNTPHTITVHGEDDSVQDGNQPYTIITGLSSSSDPHYDMRLVPDVALVNDDNDTAGYKISAISGDTTESGGTATFTIALTSQPTDAVSIPVMSSNTAQGALAITSIDFTTVNWNKAQTVTVTGIDDNVVDSKVNYKILLSKPTSNDANYAAKDPPDVSVTNDE